MSQKPDCYYSHSSVVLKRQPDVYSAVTYCCPLIALSDKIAVIKPTWNTGNSFQVIGKSVRKPSETK